MSTSTKAAEQQRKQRQKEFKEKKEHQERVKGEEKKLKANLALKVKRVLMETLVPILSNKTHLHS